MEEFYVDKILTFGEQTKVYEYKVGNQHDVNSNIIRFTNQDLFVPGFYYYVIITSEYDEKVRHILIENNEFKIPSFMTKYPGKYLCQVAFTNKKIELNEQINKSNFIKMSNKFYLKTIRSIFDEDDEVEGLDSNIKFLYDELLELKDTLIYKLENNLFDGLSAYEIAVNNGFVGDEDQWLDSLKYDHSDEFQQLALQVENNVKITNENVLKAKSSEDDSKLSEINAKNSEDNSKLYSENSSMYCNDAKNHSDSASLAADNAKQSEYNSKNSEVKAKEYHDNSSQILDNVRNIANEYINNSKEQTNLFNENFNNKIISFNEQAAIKKKEFDDNSNLKVFIFDQDYNQKKTEIENKINDFNNDFQIKSTEINEISETVKANAQNALDSANLAKESASGAILAKEKALEHMSNAEGFKNDASNYADQANAANAEAQKSAADASNSASNALDSANKAKEHLDNVTEKVNAFNTDVEQANNTLNTKISTANTDIDKKVLDANNALDTKIADANTSMDAKVAEATTQANIATTKATELSQAVDKVKHLEDVIDTKLTQPYVSSPIVENTTISDSDEGQLRNLRVYGKCTQKVETDIVPTPEREVPIVSKKINVNGETVELRSLKESANLFDLGLLSKTELIPKVGAYRKIDIPLQLKPSTKYTFSYDPWEVPALSWLVLNIVNADGAVLCGVFNYNNTSTEPLSINSGKHSFTTDATGYVYFSYYANGGDNPYINLWFAKLLKNIMLVEGTTVPTSYIPPTTRDYKIVDHVNKRSWIERNIVVENLSNVSGDWWRYDNVNSEVSTFHISITNRAFGNTIMSNKLKTINASWDSNEKYVISGHHNFNNVYINVDKSIDTVEKFLEWNTGIVIQYQLKTPITEEITYSESDTSEFGQSFQDNTSPSLNIKSEIETVDVLSVKACAKNMFNPLDLSGGEIVNYNGVDCYKYKDSNNNFVFDFSDNVEAKAFTFTTRIFREDGISNGTYMLFRYSDGSKTIMQVQIINQIYNFKSDPSKVLKQVEGNNSWSKTCYIDLSVTQLEEGDIATEYEPYKGTAITHTLKKPLVKCGDIADTIDLNSLMRTNNNYFGLLDLANQGITYGGIVGNYRSCYWRANTMPKPKLLTSNFDKNNLICSRFVADLNRYNSNIGETISIYKDGSADFIATFNINRFKDVAEFKQFFIDNPTMVAYPLATPTVEPLEPALVEKLKTLMSFYPITHIFSNVPFEFDYKMNLENWHKVVSGQVENAKDVIYNIQVQQNNLEVIQLQSALETQYNLDLMKLGGGM